MGLIAHGSVCAGRGAIGIPVVGGRSADGSLAWIVPRAPWQRARPPAPRSPAPAPQVPAQRRPCIVLEQIHVVRVKVRSSAWNSMTVGPIAVGNPRCQRQPGNALGMTLGAEAPPAHGVNGSR